MPLYQFECVCGLAEELFREIATRDAPVLCSRCGQQMRRLIGATVYHGEVFQTKAILSDGRKIKGHFGKSAPLQRKRSSE